MGKQLLNVQRQFFYEFCDELQPLIARSATNMCSPVEVERQVALTLYYLSDERRLRKTAYSFGLSRPCFSVMVRRVAHAMSSHLGPKHIKFPLNVNVTQSRETVPNHTLGKIKLTAPAYSHTTVLLDFSLNFGLLSQG